MLTVVLDTETTGFHPEQGDELLQVSIIDNTGEVLYNQLIRPTFTREWPEAMKVNNITPEMVADCPSIEDEASKIKQIIEAADEIIGYNTLFDLNFLERCAGIRLREGKTVIDVMDMTRERLGYSKFIKLTDAAFVFGFDWGAKGLKAHDSLADVYATLHVYIRHKYLEVLDRENEEWRVRHGQ